MLGYNTATVIFSMLGKSLICIAYSVVYVFGNEIFPTEVRNVGVGTAIMGSHVTSMTAAYVGGPMVCDLMITYLHILLPRVGPWHPLFCPFTSSSFSLLLFSFFHWLYLFSSFVHPFPFYHSSPTPFPGRRS